MWEGASLPWMVVVVTTPYSGLLPLIPEEKWGESWVYPYGLCPWPPTHPTPFTSVLGVFSSQSSIPSKFILCMVLKPSDINLLYTHTLENELILCRRQIC